MVRKSGNLDSYYYLPMTSTSAQTDHYLSTQRLESFSDGVFAIAITLLILEIRVPSSDDLLHQTLTSYLYKLWPKYFAYVFSFVIIGIYWANHHYIFKLYVRTNHVFNIMNVVFLMTIAFLPFPTAIFGEYINDIHYRSIAVTFYDIGIALPAVLWLLMWLYASYKKRLVDQRLKDHFIRYLDKLFITSNFLYLLSVVISFFSSIASVCVSVFLTLLFLFPPKKPEYS
jgi:uncharacterized membrane protein